MRHIVTDGTYYLRGVELTTRREEASVHACHADAEDAKRYARCNLTNRDFNNLRSEPADAATVAAIKWLEQRGYNAEWTLHNDELLQRTAMSLGWGGV